MLCSAQITFDHKCPADTFSSNERPRRAAPDEPYCGFRRMGRSVIASGILDDCSTDRPKKAATMAGLYAKVYSNFNWITTSSTFFPCRRATKGLRIQSLNSTTKTPIRYLVATFTREIDARYLRTNTYLGPLRKDTCFILMRPNFSSGSSER